MCNHVFNISKKISFQAFLSRTNFSVIVHRKDDRGSTFSLPVNLDIKVSLGGNLLDKEAR